MVVVEKLKDEKHIRNFLNEMKHHAHFIRDDFQRHGYDNFMSALEYCLGDNEIINNCVECKQQELSYRQVTDDKILEEALKADLKVVDIDGRRIYLDEK